MSISFIAALVPFIACAFYAGFGPHMVSSIDLGLVFTDVNKRSGQVRSTHNSVLRIAPLGGHFPAIEILAAGLCGA